MLELVSEYMKLFPSDIPSGRTVNSKFFKPVKYWQKLSGSKVTPAVIYGGDTYQLRDGIELFPWKDVNKALDPEALVLFTCTIGRYEPRIFDSMLEWLSFNQRLLNIQRLNTINQRGNFEGKQLLAAIAHLLMKPAELK